MIDTQYIKPAGTKPVIIRVASGKGNYISGNHIVANTERSETADAKEGSCFSMQVDALLAVKELETLPVIAVQVEKEAVQNTVLDSGNDEQVVMDKRVNAFRATPVWGA